jgi:hypothetical protein
MLEVEAPIEGAARVTEADFLEASAHVPAFRWIRTYGRLLPVMWLVVAGMATMGTTHWSDVVLPLVVSGSFTLGLSFLLLRLGPRSWAKRASADTGLSKIDFRLDAQGLSVDSALRRAQLAWPALSGYAESPSVFIVYTSPQTVFVIRSGRSTMPSWGGCGSYFPSDFRHAAPRVGCSSGWRLAAS